jgi:hypothetical protein
MDQLSDQRRRYNDPLSASAGCRRNIRNGVGTITFEILILDPPAPARSSKFSRSSGRLQQAHNGGAERCDE